MRIVLVTSAFHMRRLVYLFTRKGYVVVPYPFDFRVLRKTGVTVLDFLPDSAALRQMAIALREMIGRVYFLNEF